MIVASVADGLILRKFGWVSVSQRRPCNDVEVIVASIEGLAVSLRTVPMPGTRRDVVLGVLLEPSRGHLERVGVEHNALAGRRCESKVEVSDGESCCMTVSMGA